MTFCVDKEIDLFSVKDSLTSSVNDVFDVDKLTRLVIEEVMDFEGCPYEILVNIVLTDDESIRKLNLKTRNIDKPTDVLSFPALDFNEASDFTEIVNNELNFDPDNGELILGDIIISVTRLRGQAMEYGHSLKREYAFLLTHSLLHLLGYDHLEAEEAEIMEKKQEDILNIIGIFR